MKLQYNETLSNFAFNFNLRRCTEAIKVMEFELEVGEDMEHVDGEGSGLRGGGRGLRSSAFQLNLSRF